MTIKLKSVSKSVFLIVAVLSICGCGSLIATFDQTSYSNVISVKVDALALMDKSVEDYSLHIQDVATFQLELDKAVEYDKHRPKNDFTNKQWAILTDTSGGLLGGYLVRWKNKKKMSPAALSGPKTNVAAAFDQIAELESGKMKPKQQNQ